MNPLMYERTLNFAAKRYADHDPSHDFAHVKRVVANVTYLQESLGGDMDIMVPAALLYPLVSYEWNHENAPAAAKESAAKAIDLLDEMGFMDMGKVHRIGQLIAELPLKGNPSIMSPEAITLHDACLLDNVGASGIAKAYAMTGYKKRKLYDAQDPFCESRARDPQKYTLDLLMGYHETVEGLLHSKPAKEMARERSVQFKNHLLSLSAEIGIPLPAAKSAMPLQVAKLEKTA